MLIALAPILATKLAAWEGRGHGDLLRSLDIHDLIVLADGRPELTDELANQPEDLRIYVVDRLAKLIEHPYFLGLAESAPRTWPARGRAG